MAGFDFDIEIEKADGTEGLGVTEGAQIKAIGVGGGGGNMINHMIQENVKGIDLIVANTDAQALNSSLAPIKIQLGVNATRGLGAGMKPEVGREAALENFTDIKNVLEGADIVFISAGLGGGTGTGAAPIIAQAAREVGALTVSVVTTPFNFEGNKRKKLALEGLNELKRESDSIIVIPNERLLSIVEKNLGLKESFKLVDNILCQAVTGISNVILSHGPNDINLDFADVRTVMSHRGLALMGTGKSVGANAAYDAAKAAIESPLLDNLSIKGAKGVLVHFKLNPSYPILQISEAMSIIQDHADDDAFVIFGTTTDPEIDLDDVTITIIATGFEDPETIAPATSAPVVEKEKNTNSNSMPNHQTNNTPTNNTTTVNKVRRDIPRTNTGMVPPRKNGLRRVIGSEVVENEDILEFPTFLRNQMD
jgi:cell division protein FtsZ